MEAIGKETGMAESFELVRSDVLARLQAVDKKNEDLVRDLDTAWAEREAWKRRAEAGLRTPDRVWLLTTGSGDYGDEWSVKSIHATREGAESAKAEHERPRLAADKKTTYVERAHVEEWDVQSEPLSKLSSWQRVVAAREGCVLVHPDTAKLIKDRLRNSRLPCSVEFETERGLKDNAAPMFGEALSADSARPHESLVWAIFFCEATQVVRARPIDSPWITTPAEVAEEMFDEWRARWPEESK